DGSLDSSFDPGTGANGPIYTVCLKADGSLLIGGRFSLINGSPRNYLAALKADGSLATAFSSGPGPNDAVYAVAADDDATLVAGRFTEFDGQPQQHIARVLADGSPEGSFQTNTGPNDSVFSIFPAGESKVVIGGSFTSIAGQMMARIARVGRDGTPDPDLNPNKGIGTDIYSIIALGTGQILIGGGFRNIDGNGQSGFARLQANGSLDQAFRPPLTNTFVGSAALQKTGKIVISGIIYPNGSTNFLRLARLNPDGSLDAGFNSGTNLDGRVQAIGVQPDDRIVVIGSFLHFNGLSAR